MNVSVTQGIWDIPWMYCKALRLYSGSTTIYSNCTWGILRLHFWSWMYFKCNAYVLRMNFDVVLALWLRINFSAFRMNCKSIVLYCTAMYFGCSSMHTRCTSINSGCTTEVIQILSLYIEWNFLCSDVLRLYSVCNL